MPQKNIVIVIIIIIIKDYNPMVFEELILRKKTATPGAHYDDEAAGLHCTALYGYDTRHDMKASGDLSPDLIR